MSYFTTGHFHIGYMCTLQRMKPISLFILGSVFSDCVVFYGDFFTTNHVADDNFVYQQDCTGTSRMQHSQTAEA